jgi:exodeoxyribonuclease VII large subunit
MSARAARAGAILPRFSAAPVQARLREATARLEGLAARLESVSHKAVLARGYALLFDAKGHPVTRALQIAPGAALTVTLADGDVAVTANGGRARQASLDF